MRRLVPDPENLLSELMGHLVQEDLSHGVPGMVQDKIPTDRNFPFLSGPGSEFTVKIAETEKRSAHAFAIWRIQDPERGFPLAGQTVNNPPLQLLLVIYTVSVHL